MTRSFLFLIGGAAVLAASFIVWKSRKMIDASPSEVAAVDGTTALPSGCIDLSFDGAAYIVCTVDAARNEILLRRTAADDAPLKGLEKLAEVEPYDKAVASRPFDFAMNAGMYHEDFAPVGLYVEDGRETTPLNAADAAGNFFMKPNGVFFVEKDGNPGVLTTEAYAAAKPQVTQATQSGPMLVIDGALHPRFEHDGQSRHIRNGVGVDPSGRAVFAISRGPVSLGNFARLFRDALECPNALFFDGAISALHDGQRYIVGGNFPAGPMVLVRSRSEPGS